MKREKVRYVRLDPEGNITCLVLSRVPPEERERVTAVLMDRCEQVGYLVPPASREAAAGLQMMGGEFCGNAAMATAAWLAAGKDPESLVEQEMLLEVSGAEKPVACRVRKEGRDWLASVEMPLPLGTEPCEILGEKLEAVHLPGMVHLIRRGDGLSRERAEQMLRAAAEIFPEPAAGLLQWQAEESEGKAPCGVQRAELLSGRLIPLVWVRESRTLVWEAACGRGTAAAACLDSIRRGASLAVSARQPGGGRLQAETLWGPEGIRWVTLSGRIRMEAPALLDEEMLERS